MSPLPLLLCFFIQFITGTSDNDHFDVFLHLPAPQDRQIGSPLRFVTYKPFTIWLDIGAPPGLSVLWLRTMFDQRWTAISIHDEVLGVVSLEARGRAAVDREKCLLLELFLPPSVLLESLQPHLGRLVPDQTSISSPSA